MNKTSFTASLKVVIPACPESAAFCNALKKRFRTSRNDEFRVLCNLLRGCQFCYIKQTEKDMNIFLNKALVPESEAVVLVYDHGFLYGDGIYETMRAYNGVVFMLEKHLERLCRSASITKLSLPETGFITDAVLRTIEANKLSEAYVRVTVSRGKGPIGLDPALCKEPTFVVVAEDFREYPGHLYSEGVKLIIAQTRRNLVSAISPRIKSLNFLNNIFAKMEAKERGAYEAIMLNAEGMLAEGTVCNIFFVKDNVLCTPAAEVGVLDGITRELVISMAQKKRPQCQ